MRLAADDLAFGYPRHRVGAGVRLALSGGEVLALLGPNGAGQTTLLKTLLGLIPPQAGAVTLDGRPLSAFSVQDRARHIAYVPQSHHAVFAFTALDIVLMGRTAHGGLFSRPSARDREIAEAVLGRLGIAHLAGRPTNEISGGERQRVLIARALAQEPRFVVLDEPTASLDFGNQGKVMNHIRRLAADGLGILFTTHDPNQALNHADRVLLLKDGAVMAEGPAASVLTCERLEALYGTMVHMVSEAGKRAVFLPG